MTRADDPFAFVPRTGNPALDALTRSAADRAADYVFGRLDPRAQQLVGTLWSALSPGGATPRLNNPVTGTGAAPVAGDGDKARFVGELLALDGGLLVTLGKRGSGKTAFDLKLAQRYHEERNRPVYVIGIPQRQLDRFGFTAIGPDALDRLPNNAVLVIDDVALFFSNRDYAQAGLLHQLVIESRHRHIVVIVNAHNSALVDKYLLEANALFLKPSSSLTADLQRSGIRQVVERADAAFAALPREARKSRIYAYSDELEYEGMLATTPPRGWSKAVSEHHGGQR